MSTMLREKMPPGLKRQSKWLAYAAITLACIAIIYTRQRLTIDPKQVTLPADGAEHLAFRIRQPLARRHSYPRYQRIAKPTPA